MKYSLQIAVLLFVCYLISSCRSEIKTKNDLVNKNLQGTVKSLTETTYKAIERFGKVEKGDFESKIISLFNQKGNLISHQEFIDDGRLVWTVNYTYNTNDKKVEENWRNEIHNFNEKYVYVYDDQNNIIEKNRYSIPNSLEWKYKYKHDEHGNVLEENWYDSIGAFVKKIIYQNDKSGNLIEERYYGSDELLYEHKENKYDRKGNVIESLTIFNFEIVGKSERSTIQSKSSFEYKFDKTGNWITQIEFSSNNPYQIVERQIEYY